MEKELETRIKGRGKGGSGLQVEKKGTIKLQEIVCVKWKL